MYQLPRVKEFQKIYEDLMRRNAAIVPPNISRKFGQHSIISSLRNSRDPVIYIASDRRINKSIITLNPRTKIRKNKNYFYIDFEW